MVSMPPELPRPSLDVLEFENVCPMGPGVVDAAKSTVVVITTVVLTATPFTNVCAGNST